MELEKAKNICKDFIKENRKRPIILHKAIETILDELENRIPREKIENKIEELENEFNNYQIDVNCTQDEYYTYSDKYAFAEEKLNELKEKK